jgi:predicted PurR-regulated permease PerM
MTDALRIRAVRIALWVASLVLLLWAFRVVAPILTPFFIAFALAYFLNPPVNAMERFFARRLPPALRVRLDPRAVAVGLLVGAMVVVLAAAVLFVVPAIVDQVRETAAKTPEYVRVLRAKIEPLYERLNLRYPEQTAEMRTRITEAVKAHLPEIVGPVGHVVQTMFSSVLGFVLTILNLVVIPVFAVYLIFDMNHIQEGLAELVPFRLRPYVYSRMSQVGGLLSAFVRGQITVCLILGVFYSIGLTLCGVPMGLLVGFVIGFFNMIPFMSYVLGLPIALTLSWVDDQSLTRLAVVAAIFTFGQFVEGNFISPRIVGGSIGLHAVVIMLAVLVGGTLFGFAGMILAVPTTAALSVFWRDLRAAYLASPFYSEGAPPPPEAPTVA